MPIDVDEREREKLRKEIIRATADIQAAELHLKEERLELRQIVKDARDRGVSVSELARIMGLSRTRIRMLIEEAEEAD